MGYPIKKTITVVWNGVDWHDQETGVLITGVTPPHPVVQEVAKHPFDKSFNVTYEQVQKMIADAIDQRTYHSPYFWPPLKELHSDGLMSYANVQRAIHHTQSLLENRIQALHTRLNAIENKKPWWKRW